MVSPTIPFMLTLAIITHAGAVRDGKIASPGQFKYQVLLKLRRDNLSGTCGGAIFDEYHVLTAWHCVWDMESENIEVVAGAVKYSNDSDAVSYQVSDIRLHKSRSCKPGELRCYDVAVLTTSRPIQLEGNVDIIDLASNDITEEERCVFVGWGDTEDSNGVGHSSELRYGYGEVYSVTTCRKAFPQMQDYEFCFLHIESDPSTIDSGDSGSPLVCNDELVGVVIRGGGELYAPVTAISVYHILDFIYFVDEVTCL